jgi:hypothetical protein
MAAPNQQELDRIKSLLSDIDKMYQKIGGKNPFKNFDTRNINDAASAIGQLEIGLRGVKDQFDSLTDRAQELFEVFKSIVNEIKNSNSAVRDSTKSYSKLGDLARKLRDDQKGIQELNSKELKSIQSKLESEVQNLRLANDMAKIEKAALDRKHKAKTLTDNDRKQRRELGETIQTNNRFLRESDGILDEMNTQVRERLEQEKEIGKRLGVSGALIKGMSKIPVLGNLINAEEVLAAAQEKAKEQGSNRLKVMGAVFSSLGKSLKTNLTDPLVVGGLLLKGFKMFLELGFAADKQITELGKSMAVTKDEAALTRDRFVEIQNSSDSLLDTTKNLVEAQGQLANAFGATRGFTDAQLQDQIMLTKQVGLEEEAAAGLQQLALANGKSADDVLKSTIKQTAALARQTGVQLDNRKVLAEVAKVSGQLRLQYQNNPDLIAKAVVQTQKLGISLEQAKNMANKLLDFENSISSELEAELLTGKSLNLENARLLALQGDSAGALAEIARQTGSAAEFSKMNVIAQQSFAEAVGMSADELANSLVYQENLAKLGSETRKQVEEQIELAKQQGDLERVRMLERSIGDEANAEKALKEISAQEKFNAAIDKLKSILGDIVSGPAAKFVDMLGNVVSSGEALKSIFTSIGVIIGTISLTRLITGLISAAVSAGALSIGAATAASALTLGIGAIAIIGSIAAISSAMDNAQKEAEARAKSGPKFATGGIVTGQINNATIGEAGPEAIIPLNSSRGKEILGTNLGGGNNSDETNTLLKEVLNRPVKVDVGNFFNDSARSAVRIQ